MFSRLLKRLYHNDPFLWRLAIERFALEDRRSPPPADAVLFAGSSSIRFWNSLEQDMAPYPVINRGFGGSMIHQVVHYMDRIILPCEPAAIFLYAGENDIAGLWLTRRHSAGEVCDNFREFCERAHGQLPAVPIHYISIKPALRRQKYWPEMEQANRMIEEFCATDDRLRYVDIVPAMHNKAGELRKELFKMDGVHLNSQGYAVWTDVIRPVVADLAAGGVIPGG